MRRAIRPLFAVLPFSHVRLAFAASIPVDGFFADQLVILELYDTDKSIDGSLLVDDAALNGGYSVVL